MTYRFSIRFANTLCDDFAITFLVTCVFAIFALISRCVFEEFTTQSATHNLIELLHNEFMAIDLMDFFFALADCSLTTEGAVELSFPAIFLDYI